MKKDKEWLEKQINKTLKIDGGSGERIGGFNKGLEFSLDLIDQLDEPEINEEQALNKLAESYPFSVDGINAILQAQIAGYSPVSTVKFVQPSEPELPVIPQFVDKWVRSFDSEGGSKWDLLGVVTNMTSANVSKVDADIFNWLNDGNRKLFMDAITNGYTIEKEIMYHVLDQNRKVMIRKYRGVVERVNATMSPSDYPHWQKEKLELTEKEIKDYDERYWAFAEEVPNE